MASAIAAEGQAAFAHMLATLGESCTTSQRKTSLAYDSTMSVVDTATNWSDIAMFTAVLQVPSARRMLKIRKDYGIEEQDLSEVYAKYDVVLREGDQLTIGGVTYYIRLAPQATKAYRWCMVSHTEGQERDG